MGLLQRKINMAIKATNMAAFLDRKRINHE
nr:MAG TPA: hypothetical protein [Caudoviricetes sp.]